MTIVCSVNDSKFDGSSVTWVGLEGVEINPNDPKAVISWGRYWTLRETNINTRLELINLAQFSMHSISRSHQRMDCTDADLIVDEVGTSLVSVALMGEVVKRLDLKQVFAPSVHGMFVGQHSPNRTGAPPLDFRTYLDYERLSPRWSACAELFENAASAFEINDIILLVMDPFADLSPSISGHIDRLVERLSKREFSWLREEYQPRFDPDRLAWEHK